MLCARSRLQGSYGRPWSAACLSNLDAETGAAIVPHARLPTFDAQTDGTIGSARRTGRARKARLLPVAQPQFSVLRTPQDYVNHNALSSCGPRPNALLGHIQAASGVSRHAAEPRYPKPLRRECQGIGLGACSLQRWGPHAPAAVFPPRQLPTRPTATKREPLPRRGTVGLWITFAKVRTDGQTVWPDERKSRKGKGQHSTYTISSLSSFAPMRPRQPRRSPTANTEPWQHCVPPTSARRWSPLPVCANRTSTARAPDGLLR